MRTNLAEKTPVATTGPEAESPTTALEQLVRISRKAQRILPQFLAKQSEVSKRMATDPLNFMEDAAFLTGRFMTHPWPILEAQMNWWLGYSRLVQNTMLRMMGFEDSPSIVPAEDDKRFKSEAWESHPWYSFMKQAYLLNSRCIQAAIEGEGGKDVKEARKIRFYTRQFVDACSPANFALTNPEVLNQLIDSHGQSLLKGYENFLDDLERGHGNLNIRMTDLEAFEVGKNIATTPGKVVYRTDLMELIQYSPATEQVFEKPLLIVPPWINKYYILDLQAKNSYVKWAVDQGHTVFIVSWVNPDERLAQKSFEDYMTDGTLAALDAIEKATGEKEVNAVGYCLGGTLLSATLAYLAAKGEKRVANATFLATLTDFTEVGEIGIFVDEKQLTSLEKMMNERGYLDGSEMSLSFNMLRENDLIWSYFINNYLKGKEPMQMDLLYWNADSTRMPAKMHSFYLRKMYLENAFIQPGGIELKGEKIDLRKIDIPVYMICAREDHIAPWKSSFIATQVFKGPIRFVLGGSGHIAGIVNPPTANRYKYWTNDTLTANPDEWLANTTEHPGSWWTDWQAWISERAGEKVPARTPGSKKMPALCDAPGTYVRKSMN